MLLYVAVMVSSWYGGLGPGLVSLVACTAGHVVFTLPAGVSSLETFPNALLLAVFVFVANVILTLNYARQRAHRAEQVEREGRIASERAAADRSAEYVAERAERERAERAQQYFLAILEGAPDAMVIVDAAGTIVLANSQVETLLGYRPAELIGEPVERLVPDRVRATHPAYRAAYFGDPRVRPMGAGLDLSARRRDDAEVPVEISLSPLDVDGNALVIAAIRDVTERKRLQEDRARAHAEVERVRDDLTSMVVHDLKNPVN
jgi:protein-histidine pros-kinase